MLVTMMLSCAALQPTPPKPAAKPRLIASSVAAPAAVKPEWLGDPASEVQAALAWMVQSNLTANPVEAYNWRFLSAYNLAPTDRDLMDKALRFTVNALNFENSMAPVLRVGPSLWAVDIRDPGWSAAAWEKTFAQQTYFQANWLPVKEWAELLAATGSAYPIVRADQFLVLATLDPGYYDLLGLPRTQKELLAKLKVSFADNAAIGSDLAGNVIRDLTVTQNNRRLVRLRGVRTTWISFDVENGKGRKNVLKQLGKPADNEKEKELHELDADGNEIIFELANGLHGYWLNNAAGNRVAEVPTKIAKDDNYRDRTVKAGRSCITCHANGMQPFRDHFSEMLETGGVGLRGLDKRTSLQLNRFYDQFRLQPLVQVDSLAFAQSVTRATGLTTAENAKAFTDFHRGYVENRVGLREAAIDMGLPEAATLGLMREALATKSFLPSNDPNLAQLAIGKTIARDAWEDSFFAAMVLRVDVKIKAPIAPPKTAIMHPEAKAQPTSPTMRASSRILLPRDLGPGAAVFDDLEIEPAGTYAVVGHKPSPASDGKWEVTNKGGKVRWVYRRPLGAEWNPPKWLDVTMQPGGTIRIEVRIQ